MSNTTLTAPLRGGIKNNGKDQKTWTGGSPTGSNLEKKSPATDAAMRPQSYRGAVKREKTCETPLPETKHLGLPDAQKTPVITFTEWMTEVATHCRKTGMDSAFCVRKSVNDVDYIDLFDEWDTFSNSEIDHWLTTETFDKYDYENLRVSGMHIKKSIKWELWRRLDLTLRGKFEGPRILVAIIREHQQHARPSTIRALIAEIEDMSIHNEAGNNVTELATKIHQICRRMAGMVKTTDLPRDLPEVCAVCFLRKNTLALAFNIHAVQVYRDARGGNLTWEQVLTSLKNEYVSLAKNNNQLSNLTSVRPGEEVPNKSWLTCATWQFQNLDEICWYNHPPIIAAATNRNPTM